MNIQRAAVGYVRVSTAKQAEEGVSLDAQRAKIQAHCDLHGLTLIDVRADEGISGKRYDNRPGLQKALALACKHKAVLVVYSLTRLARSTRDCIAICDKLEKYNADLAIITDKIDTTSSMGRFVFRLMASLGELERDQISERTCAALSYKRSKGECVGTVPYGFKLLPDGIHLAPEPSEQIIVGYMVRRYAEGAGPKMIAGELNRAGIKPRRGKQWYRSGVWSILNLAKRRKAAA